MTSAGSGPPWRRARARAPAVATAAAAADRAPPPPPPPPPPYMDVLAGMRGTWEAESRVVDARGEEVSTGQTVTTCTCVRMCAARASPASRCCAPCRATL